MYYLTFPSWAESSCKIRGPLLIVTIHLKSTPLLATDYIAAIYMKVKSRDAAVGWIPWLAKMAKLLSLLIVTVGEYYTQNCLLNVVVFSWQFIEELSSESRWNNLYS